MLIVVTLNSLNKSMRIHHSRIFGQQDPIRAEDFLKTDNRKLENGEQFDSNESSKSMKILKCFQKYPWVSTLSTDDCSTFISNDCIYSYSHRMKLFQNLN